MRRLMNWSLGLFIPGMILCLGIQGNAADKSFAHPPDVQLEPGENAIAVTWDASPDEAKGYFTGYTVYFDTKSSAELSPDQLENSINIKKNVHEYVVKGLENDREYFIHVRSHQGEGAVNQTGIVEKTTTPQLEGDKFDVSMFDYDVAMAGKNCAYGWNRQNGQDVPGHPTTMQYVKYIDILVMESPTTKSKSVFVSPSEAEFTKDWPVSNKTLFADLGTDWNVAESIPETAFATTTEIKNGHVYVIKTFDDFHIKLRIKSIEEVNMLLPYGSERSNVDINKITFTYVSQISRSYEDFLAGTIVSAP